MAWYRFTGSITNGARAVTGTLTAFTAQVKAEDRISFDGGGKWYEVASVGSNTALTLATDFLETTVAGGACVVDRSGRGWSVVSDLAARVAALLAQFPTLAGAADTLKLMRANAGGTALEFVAGSLPPVLAVGGADALKVVRANAAGTALELAAASGGGTNPNLLINGDFQINQRSYAGASLTAGAYGRDRWKADTGSATYSVSGYVFTLSSGTIVQVVESALWGVANLASTQVTISIDTPSADMTVTLGSVSGTITAGSGRRSVTLTTGAGDTGNLSLKLAKASGSGVTFGRVKLEVGAAATAWEARSAKDELALARRYFHKPAAATTYVAAAANVSALLSQQIEFPAPMRATPTFSAFVNPYNGDPQVSYFNGSANVSVDTSGVAGQSALGFQFYLTKSGALTTGAAYSIQGGCTADAEL